MWAELALSRTKCSGQVNYQKMCHKYVITFSTVIYPAMFGIKQVTVFMILKLLKCYQMEFEYYLPTIRACDRVYEIAGSFSRQWRKQMKQKLTVLCVLVLVVSAMVWTNETTAYPTFDDGCTTCHDWGYGTPTHQAHFGNGCSSCHEVTGDNPLTSTCASCHGGVFIMNFHNNNGISSCIVCHEASPNDNFSWGQTKQLFR